LHDLFDAGQGALPTVKRPQAPDILGDVGQLFRAEYGDIRKRKREQMQRNVLSDAFGRNWPPS
jgi:hypothetical protein